MLLKDAVKNMREKRDESLSGGKAGKFGFVAIKKDGDDFYSLKVRLDSVCIDISSNRETVRRFKTVDSLVRALGRFNVGHVEVLTLTKGNV